MLPNSLLWEKVRSRSDHAVLLCISIEYLDFFLNKLAVFVS